MTVAPALLDMIQHLSWRPPAVVQEVVDVRSDAEAFRRSALRQVERVEQALAHWEASGNALRERLWAAATQTSERDEFRAIVDRLVPRLDARLAQDADETRRLEKAFRRQSRNARRISVQVGCVVDQVARRTLKATARESAAVADLGLFLRALRAELDPRSRSGETFRDPDALRQHLRAAMH